MPDPDRPVPAWRRALVFALCEGRDLLRETDALIRRRLLIVCALLVLLFLLFTLLLPHDFQASHGLHHHRAFNPIQRDWSKVVRVWGAFIDVPVFSLLVLLLGWGLRRLDIRRAALACLLGGLLAGLIANVGRFTVGRPRPKLEMPDGIYGLSFNYDRQSFPSGHTAAATGGAVALALAWPPAGAIPLISAAAVGWSSWYNRAHYVSDVAVGAGLGLVFGGAVGLACRRRNAARQGQDEGERTPANAIDQPTGYTG